MTVADEGGGMVTVIVPNGRFRPSDLAALVPRSCTAISQRDLGGKRARRSAPCWRGCALSPRGSSCVTALGPTRCARGTAASVQSAFGLLSALALQEVYTGIERTIFVGAPWAQHVS